MSTPKRIQRKRTKGFKLPEGVVCVTRPTKWGNPYRVKDYDIREADDTPAPKAVQLREARAMAVRDFEHWLGVTPEGEAVAAAARVELRGKDLACWCPLDAEDCHADVLLRISNEDP